MTDDTAAAEPYPKELDVALDDVTFTSEDYPALRKKYGKFAVLLLRGPGEISACLTVSAIVKVGVLGRHTKAVPTSVLTEYLSPSERRQLEPHVEVLVCSPPLDASMALVIAELARTEESFFETKLLMLNSLDAILGFTPERVEVAKGEMVRYLHSASMQFQHKVELVEPPTGEWKVYTHGDEIPQADLLTNAIKNFAKKSARVYPPLPPVDDKETGAILAIHDLLVERQMESMAHQLITAALCSPQYTRLCHYPELFAKNRKPPLEVEWAGFGEKLLNYLFSEEVTHAARRTEKSDPVTPAEPFVLNLEELIAMGVPHAPLSVDHGEKRLNAYIGGYLSELDLRHTLITGSAMAAALIITDVEHSAYNCSKKFMLETVTPAIMRTTAPPKQSLHERIADLVTYETHMDQCEFSYKAYLAAHYPPNKTVPRDRVAYMDLVSLVRRYPTETDVKYKTATLDNKVVLTLKAKRRGCDLKTLERCTAELDVYTGADVDMSIVVKTNEEFDSVAQGHFGVVCSHYPEAVLSKVLREDKDPNRYKWSITCLGVDGSGFRPVEMYRADFNHVLTHHVGMVRGAYTAMFSEKDEPPQFVVAASFALSMANLATPNYYYFASSDKTKTPQDIVMKYFMRGFSLKSFPSGLQTSINKFYRNCPLWGPEGAHWRYYGGYNINAREFPALFGKGNFSAYSLWAELNAWSSKRYSSA